MGYDGISAVDAPFRFKIIDMPRIFDTLDGDHIVKLYSGGNTLKSVADAVGVNPGTIRKVLVSHGIPIRNKTEQAYMSACAQYNVPDIVQGYIDGRSANSICNELGMSENTFDIILKFNSVKKRSKGEQSRVDGKTRREARLDVSAVESLYADGIGVRGIADKFGVAPSVIKRMLEDRGHTIRNRSEQQFARMQRTPEHKRKQLVQKAHEAVRGKPATRESRIKIAQTCQAKGERRNSRLESTFLEMMKERGVNFSQQIAIGSYNCDFAIGSIAVEIWGGGWHFTGEHAARFPERTSKILDSGFDLVILPFVGRFKLVPEVADHLVAFLDELSRNPPPTRQYWVIWGAGEAIVSGSSESIDKALVVPFENRRNPSNGRYESILR